MRKHTYLLYVVIGVVLGFCGALMLVTTVRQGDGLETLSEHDVVAFAKSKDEGALSFWEFHRTPEFVYICNHLDEMVDVTEKEKSRTLWFMLWRAAYLTGSREQIAKVFNRYMVSEHSPFTPNYVVHDLSHDGLLTDWLLFNQDSIVSEGALNSLIVGLADRSPDSWGHQPTLDYTPILTALMRSTERPISTRILAAYALARWSGSTPLGLEAQDALASWAEEDYVAKDLYNSLQVLGTEGWVRPETQPDR